MIVKSDFDGYGLYTLTAGDLEVSVTELGAAVTRLRWRGRTLSLGYETAAEYLGAAPLPAGESFLKDIIQEV